MKPIWNSLRMIPERLLFLGPDLAAAHFLVHRGASVKFVGDDTWYKKDKNNRYNLPGTKIPDLYLEAIDASGTELMFEGFENLQSLNHLRMLRLADCPYIDDWALSRIGGMMNRLEMLDLSGCHRVSAKGK
uniref:ATP synthase subunit s, mitochondrial n=1 Tax=Angiostrongylus cantonensis TaxID=6313 RepID=A0A0K0DBS2_ANGCA